jgi:hypothetical protein
VSERRLASSIISATQQTTMISTCNLGQLPDIRGCALMACAFTRIAIADD